MGENMIAIEQGPIAVTAGLNVAGYLEEALANTANVDLLEELSAMGVDEYNVARVAAGNTKKAQRNANEDRNAINTAATEIEPA